MIMAFFFLLVELSAYAMNHESNLSQRALRLTTLKEKVTTQFGKCTYGEIEQFQRDIYRNFTPSQKINFLTAIDYDHHMKQLESGQPSNNYAQRISLYALNALGFFNVFLKDFFHDAPTHNTELSDDEQYYENMRLLKNGFLIGGSLMCLHLMNRAKEKDEIFYTAWHPLLKKFREE